MNLKIAAILIALCIHTPGFGQTQDSIARWKRDSLIKWSNTNRLTYTDFQDTPGSDVNLDHPDTLAIIATMIGYKVVIDSGKAIIHCFAIAYPRESWMRVKEPCVLRHEQGHFDIAEIYARRLDKMIGDTTIVGLSEYLHFFMSLYEKVQGDLTEEQKRYDAWTMNTPGHEYYYKWIDEQLAGRIDN